MKNKHPIVVIIICMVCSLSAQIRFTPPKIKKQVDTTSQKKQIVSPVPAPAPANSPVFPTAPTVSASVSDSGELSIPDSIVIPQLDFNNQPIQDVLRLLSAPYGINMAVDPGLKAKITLRLTKIKLKDAITFIVHENSYSFRVKNGIIQVFQAAPAPPPLPLPPPTRAQLFTLKENLLTVDLKNAVLDSVIHWIALKTGKNVIPEKGMTNEITAFFTDMAVDKGLRVLFETNGLALSEKDGLNYLIPSGGGFDDASKEKSSRVKYFVTEKNKKISFNVNNAPISEIIKEIARQSNLQVYVYSDISGTITAKVDSVPVEEAFESLLRNTSSTYWLSRGIYFFADKSSYEKKVVDLIPVNYLQANDIIPLLPAAVASKATIKTVKEYNALLVEASTSDIIEQARNFITLLDKPIAQILIEAWVVEVKVDKARQFGVKMFGRNSGQATTATTYYPTFSKEYDRAKVTEFMEKYLNVKSTITAVIPEDFAMQIQALENEGISNLISKPQIATLNGHTATITFGTTQFFTLEKQVVVPGNNGNVVEKVQEREKIDVNMTLSVTPWVSSNNEVTMEVSPTFDVPGTSPGTNMPPPIDRRSLNSKVRVKSGEMIILGGLIGESQRKYIDKVPILGNIPVIGWLFSTKKTDNNKTQLMIYLIPHVYYGSEKSIDPTKIDFNSPKNTPTILESEAKSKKPLKKHWWFLWLR